MNPLDRLEKRFTLYINNECSKEESVELEKELESDLEVWKRWNEFRWQRARGTIDLSELEEFLGDKFTWGLDSSWGLVEKWNLTKRETKEQIQDFYKNNDLYLYNLIIWAASGHRPKYVDSTIKYLDELNIRSIIDYGCGVGTDGLDLLSKNKKVYFCDINSSCIEFVKWRLNKRNANGIIVTLPELKSIGPVDAVWLMDVIEHISDPIDDALIHIVQDAKFVIYDSHSTDDASGRHPFHINRNSKDISSLWNSLGFSLFRTIKTINIYSK